MLHQLDAYHALITGYLNADPSERKDKTGKRMVVLDVVYDRMRHRNPSGQRSRLLRLSVVVFGEYTSYARTLVKGDCVLAVGQRPLEPPKGYEANPMLVGKQSFGFIGGTGITRAWKSEADAYTKNVMSARVKEIQESNRKEDDKFDEIQGDWY